MIAKNGGKMIYLKDFIYIVIGLITISSGVVGFFVMQTKQNMRIDQLEKDLNCVGEKQSKSTGYQIETEKAIVSINEKLGQLLEDVKELKDRGQHESTS